MGKYYGGGLQKRKSAYCVKVPVTLLKMCLNVNDDQ